jgi:hypothetical protein
MIAVCKHERTTNVQVRDLMLRDGGAFGIWSYSDAINKLPKFYVVTICGKFPNTNQHELSWSHVCYRFKSDSCIERRAPDFPAPAYKNRTFVVTAKTNHRFGISSETFDVVADTSFALRE